MFSLVAHGGRKSQHGQAVHVYIYIITFDVEKLIFSKHQCKQSKNKFKENMIINTHHQVNI
jgi:hypothetical protein